MFLLESAVPAEQRSLLARVRHGKRKHPVWALTSSGLESLATTARGARVLEVALTWPACAELGADVASGC